MHVGIKQVAVFLLIAIVAVTAIGCEASDSPSEALGAGSNSHAVDFLDSLLPFTDAEDITASFTQKEVNFSERIATKCLVCTQIAVLDYAEADETVNLPDKDVETMILHGTWDSAARTIYIGLINETSGDVYVLPAVGGALAGTLDLVSLPEGEYRPIMYSSDNENVNAVMLYQFQ